MTLELVPLEGLPEVAPGDDLAALLEPALAPLVSEGDVLAITQKVVSKAEGRIVPALDRDAWIERESVAVVARRGELVIARTRHGFVCANAGVDASNVPAGVLTLLPEDPDGSAERLQKELGSRLGLSSLGVVITDTFGRPWREGVIDVAIGCAGLPAILDLRGTPDDRGRPLESTVMALADAIAAASGLVMTKTARVPAALVRGLDAELERFPHRPARALVRDADEDLFRESPIETLAAGPSSTFSTEPVPDGLVEEAVGSAAAGATDGRWWFSVLRSLSARRRALVSAGGGAELPPLVIVVGVRDGADRGRPDETRGLAAGAVVRTLVLGLHARGLAWSWDPAAPVDRAGVAAALELGNEWRPLAVVGTGRPAKPGAGRPRAPRDPPVDAPG
jgi:coenzyme F420-0:L-glutamate ligase/coenzyme F420-1:gamma-L-glutamate ligase